MRDKMTQVHVGMCVYVCACVCVDMWGGGHVYACVLCVWVCVCGGVCGCVLGARASGVTLVRILGSFLHNKVSGRMLHLPLHFIPTTFCIYYTYFQQVLQIYFWTFHPRILSASSHFLCQYPMQLIMPIWKASYGGMQPQHTNLALGYWLSFLEKAQGNAPKVRRKIWSFTVTDFLAGCNMTVGVLSPSETKCAYSTQIKVAKWLPMM